MAKASVEKRDHLALCNDQGIPEVDFRRAFCDRCVQPECSRSRHGQSKFDQRVNSWRERFFTEVPRMAASDPRYSELAADRFPDLPVSSGPTWGARPEEAVSTREGGAEARLALFVRKPEHLLLANTAHPSPLLPGAPAPPPPRAPVDPWAAPVPAGHDSSIGQVVSRGAQIKFGPGGVEG
jgi:hypothetical protein